MKGITEPSSNRPRLTGWTASAGASPTARIAPTMLRMRSGRAKAKSY